MSERNWDASGCLFIMVDYLIKCEDIRLFESLVKEFEEGVIVNEPVFSLFHEFGWDGDRFTKFTTIKIMRQAFSAVYMDGVKVSMCNNVDTVIQSYSPASLLAIVFDGNEPYLKSSTFIGVCLIINIAGFTKLTTEYSSMGINDLQQLANGYLGHIFNLVYQYDGDGKTIFICC